MDQPNYRSTHPSNPRKKFKRSHDATPLTPSTDVLRPEECRMFNGREGPNSAYTLTGTGGSHAQHPLDLSIGGQKSSEPVISDIGTRGSRAQAQVRNASHSQLPQIAVLAESVATPDVIQSNAFFRNAHHFNLSGNPNFHNNVTNFFGEGMDDWRILGEHVSFNALHDSSVQDPSRQCHPGTRENALERLRDWVDNPNPTERIFWLYGPVGAGKSAIAQTIARSYREGEVAATFFFFRSDPSRNDGNRLFTTIAWQLALSIAGTKDDIVHSLNQRPHLPMSDVETQFDQLVAQPSLQTLEEVAPGHVAPVIIIDGIDECTDENLQRRFLKVIGDAVADDRFPLRFLIVSRPEVHIEQTIRRFQTPILTIDLAELDDANRDIEKYLVDEFSRIASEQGLDPTWPGQAIIDDIVYKSSGNFVYAFVVIKFVGDPYCFAKTQLDIVLNIKPPKTMSPFAILDQLFLEILRRVPDQDFLKRYLGVLTARISASDDYIDLYKDDAVLMHVSEEELRANLRRMRSLLKFEPHIDVHHKSFLDFLHDSARSGHYYIGQHGGMRRYLEVFVDSLVQYASAVIEQPTHHNVPHFTPIFRIDLLLKRRTSINEWPEVMQPLLDFQDKLLQLPNFPSTWHPLHCDECTIFYLLRELLHLGLHLEAFNPQNHPSFQSESVMIRNRRGVASSTTNKKMTNGNDLDSLLLSLFAHLPGIMKDRLPTKKVIKLVSAILRFDYAETATRVCFVSDAQKLVDLLYYLIYEKNALGRIGPDAARKATLLAFEVFARVPTFPRSFSFDCDNESHHIAWEHTSTPFEILAQTLFASKILDRRYIAPVLAVNFGPMLASCTEDSMNGVSMNEWRQRLFPTSMAVIQIMLGLAKAIQHLHSMGVILYRQFGLDNVFLDSDLRPKICCLCSTSRFLLKKSWKEWFVLEDNIFSFGCLLYELYSGIDASLFPMKHRRSITTTRPSVPEIPEFVWQLIQRCCAEDPKRRPPMDEVVQEMEGWNIE